MLEFFHGWKRKVGCITLGLACLYTGIWLGTLEDILPYVYLNFAVEEARTRITGEIYFSTSTKSTLIDLAIPYWSIAIPLTAISAWLLLSKPRTGIEPIFTPISESA